MQRRIVVIFVALMGFTLAACSADQGGNNENNQNNKYNDTNPYYYDQELEPDYGDFEPDSNYGP